MNKNTWLLLFIVAAVAVASVAVVRYLRAQPPPNARLVTPIPFRCEKCGRAFTLMLDQLVAQWKDVPVTGTESGDRATCPKCQARFAGVRVSQEDFARGDVDPATIKPVPPPPDRRKLGAELSR